MIRDGRIESLFSLLLTAALLSVALLSFSLVERSPSPEAFIKTQNSFLTPRDIHFTASVTTSASPNGGNESQNHLTGKTQKSSGTKRQVLLVVGHGRSGSTFLADIFNQHPRVFYVFEPLHGLIAKQKGENYHEYASNFLSHIFQCDFSSGNAAQLIGHFFRFKSRAMSSPPFCPYEPTDPLWSSKDCLPVQEGDLENSCRTRHDTIVYKLLFDRIPGHSIEHLFRICERAVINCKVIHLIRDIRPVVMSSSKVAFFKELDRKTKPSMQQFVYSHCEVTERNLQLLKTLNASLRKQHVVVRYEDLALRPLKVLDVLYDFAGLQVLKSIKQWLLNTTQPSDDTLKQQARNPVSVVRNSLEMLNKWRLVADICDVNIMERYCRDVMQFMGYTQIKGSNVLLRNLTTPLFSETYPAQEWNREGFNNLS